MMQSKATLPNGADFDILTISVEREEKETATLLAQLSCLADNRIADVVNINSSRPFPLSIHNIQWRINGKQFEMEAVEMSAKILIIEDDHQIRRVIEGYLMQAGFEVISSGDGGEGFALLQSEKPDILILDLMLPGIDGLEITKRLRSSSDPAIARVYLIMLTARVEETDRIKGLEIGADDYVTKPFSPRELVARVRAALRRIEVHQPTTTNKLLTFGTLQLDPTYRQVTLDGVSVELTETEFDLLFLFMRHPGRPFSRAALLDHTQSDAYSDQSAFERTIDAHIKNLRHKLGESGRQGRFIETVHGIGYRFVPPSNQESTP